MTEIGVFFHYLIMAWAPKWHSGLRHCISVIDLGSKTLVRFQAVSQLAMIGSPMACTQVVRVRVWPG